MASTVLLEHARAAFAQRAWTEARAAYAAVQDGERVLTLDDIERASTAAHLVGEETESRDLLARGHRQALERGDVTRAARFAFWLGHGLIFTGEAAQANGWFGRARSVLSDHGVDCVEWGYLLIPRGIEQIDTGNAAAACDTFAEAQQIARRFADPNLHAMSGHGRGRALIRCNLIGEGMAVLDEVMVAVTGGEVSPMVVGDVYCGVLEACRETFDVRRAREWTAALSRWCDSQPDLVPYRGPCLVHRVELMRLRGDWEDALEEARRACEWLALPGSPEGPADAFYQLAELHRLRGNATAAEEAYAEANRLGRAPEPGLALLWLSLGRTDAAKASMQRALDEMTGDHARRADLLGASVELLLSLDDVDRARSAANELSEIVRLRDALLLQALADRAEASVRIAEDDSLGALPLLRRSWTGWQRLDAPYEAARVRVLIGRACRALGDEQSATMEFDAARWAFERLGARPDLALLEGDRTGLAVPGASTKLSLRELEVLALIAAGQTNKGIAATLVISEHTVARHIQNMLSKLGFSSRTSLAAYAVRQGIATSLDGQN